MNQLHTWVTLGNCSRHHATHLPYQKPHQAVNAHAAALHLIQEHLAQAENAKHTKCGLAVSQCDSAAAAAAAVCRLTPRTQLVRVKQSGNMPTPNAAACPAAALAWLHLPGACGPCSTRQHVVAAGRTAVQKLQACGGDWEWGPAVSRERRSGFLRSSWQYRAQGGNARTKACIAGCTSKLAPEVWLEDSTGAFSKLLSQHHTHQKSVPPLALADTHGILATQPAYRPPQPTPPPSEWLTAAAA